MSERETMQSLLKASKELEYAANQTGVYRVLKKIPIAMNEINKAMWDLYDLETRPVTSREELEDA